MGLSNKEIKSLKGIDVELFRKMSRTALDSVRDGFEGEKTVLVIFDSLFDFYLREKLVENYAEFKIEPTGFSYGFINYLSLPKCLKFKSIFSSPVIFRNSILREFQASKLSEHFLITNYLIFNQESSISSLNATILKFVTRFYNRLFNEDVYTKTLILNGKIVSIEMNAFKSMTNLS